MQVFVLYRQNELYRLCLWQIDNIEKYGERIMPLITVFTPAFNRAHTLIRTYNSLCQQSNKDFIWLIIDDGSTDRTRDLVNKWINQTTEFEIRYEYKKNGGMHTAHNLAYSLIDTELNICIDSDDMLANNAIQIISDYWKIIRPEGYAGLVGLDSDFTGNLIGTKFDQEGSIKLTDFYAAGGKGDKKLVFRTDIMKNLPPYPEFEGEKLVPLSYKYLLCDLKYNLFAINEILCNVEYQLDGSTNNIWPQYLQSPKGFAEFRKLRMKYPRNRKALYKDCCHYISNSIASWNNHYISQSPKKIMTILLTPVGFALFCYTKLKVKRRK